MIVLFNGALTRLSIGHGTVVVTIHHSYFCLSETKHFLRIYSDRNAHQNTGKLFFRVRKMPVSIFNNRRQQQTTLFLRYLLQSQRLWVYLVNMDSNLVVSQENREQDEGLPSSLVAAKASDLSPRLPPSTRPPPPWSRRARALLVSHLRLYTCKAADLYIS